MNEPITDEALRDRVRRLETELAAAAQAFAIHQRAIIALSSALLRHGDALRVIGPLVEELAGSVAPGRELSPKVADEIAELKKLFERET
jgi:hypothetical protein